MPVARLVTAEGRDIAHVELATTARHRARGLLGRRSLPPACALWLAPCRSIHTIGMRFPIDVVYLDRDSRVIAIRERVKPFRITWGGWRARGALELAAGEVERLHIVPGQLLELS